ncbi:MAG: protein kinase [Anaerolineales bacterium]|nr:protein kinase [Anaerolineales bacterium]
MAMNLKGQLVEHYRIEEIIGEGGMGTVYRANDVNLARPVAMKVMHRQFAAQTQFQQRFQQEAQAAARLDHPSIVKVYHFGREQGLLYIVMEMVPGLSLGAYIKQLAQRNQIVRLDETVLLMAQVAEALGYAHRKGVIHRDVKPDNIIIKAQDERPDEPPLRAVMTDFGLAKLLEGGVQTQSGEFMGTLAYVSPEQVMDLPLDGRSDIYSLGVVLYQLATGKLPFEVKTPSDAVLKHINQPPPSPRDIQPGLPSAVEAVILKALAKRPTERYQTGEELAHALRAAATMLSDQDVAVFTDDSQSEVVSMVMVLPEIINVEPAADVIVVKEEDTDGNTHVRGRDRLLVTREDGSTELYSLYKREFVIGRSDQNDIALRGGKVSRQHARLERKNGAWWVEDVGSTNGTMLAGRKLVPGEPLIWRAGEVLRIGTFTLQLETAVRKVQAAPLPLESAAPVFMPIAHERSAAASLAEQIAADLRPQQIKNKGVCRVLLLNKGTVTTDITVAASAPHGKLRFDAPTKQLVVVPRQKGVVDFFVEAQKRPLIGRRQTIPFRLHVNSRQHEWEQLQGHLMVKPYLSVWLFALIAFLLLLSLIAVFFVSGRFF